MNRDIISKKPDWIHDGRLTKKRIWEISHSLCNCFPGFFSNFMYALNGNDYKVTEISVPNNNYRVHFRKLKNGWNITKERIIK